MHAPPTHRWRGLAVSAAAALALAVPTAATAAPATQGEIDAAISAGAAWIADQQDKTSAGAPNPSPTGGLPGFNGNWAATGLAAAGIHAADVHKPGVPKSLQQYTFDTYDAGWGTLPGPKVAGDYAREALIATAAGIPITKISPTINLTASLASRWNAAAGTFGGTGGGFAPNSDGFALLAGDNLHLPQGVLDKIDARLRAAQKTADGGWSFSAANTGAGDIDMTGAVLSMLCQNGATVGDDVVDRGVGFLHGKLNPTTGGFGTTTVFGIPPSNAPGSSWALIGLKACGVDPQSAEWTTENDKNPVRALLDLQRSNGSFRYITTSADPAPAQDMNSTEAAIRALSDYAWQVPPPQRANPADPRWRATPAVADGTTVPIALSVDPGNGDVRFCAVQIPSGAPLTAVLETARTASVPSGCVSDWATAGSTVTTINGQTGTQWRVRFADGDSVVARDQAVGFGDVVALELARELTTTESTVDFGVQPLATIGAARAVRFTATADGTQVRRLVVDGADVDDFLVGRNTCADVTLDAGESCAASVRFAPGITGARGAELSVVGASGAAISPTVALVGQGGELPKGEPGQAGAPGVTVVGPAGPQGPTGKTGAPGKQGKTGRRGKTGKQGKTGKAAPVTCRVTGKRVQRVTCTVTTKTGTKRAVRARLTRKGKTYASGTLRAKRTKLTARATRKVTRNRYTLRLGSGRKTTNFAVRIR